MNGVSLEPLLADAAAEIASRPLYWHYPHYHPGGASPYGAIRDANYRLVEFYEDGKVELYHLADDVGEKSDLAAKLPEKRDELLARLRQWRTDVGAQMPLKNPDYDATRAEEPAGAKGRQGKKK